MTSWYSHSLWNIIDLDAPFVANAKAGKFTLTILFFAQSSVITIPSGFCFVGDGLYANLPNKLFLVSLPVIGKKLGLGGTLSLFVGATIIWEEW